MDVERNGYIKLPYGFVSNENDKQKLRFNLPLDYKKNVLFRKVPYFAEANNKAINDVVLGKKTDDLSIQKFLLGKGVLEDAVLDNLDMIVTDRRFNNAGIRRKLDKKYPSIMKKPTASHFVFRDKKQFDLQNPVIGGLYNQLQTADQLALLKKAPKIKDLKIQLALDRLKKFNLNRSGVDNDDDDDDGNIPGLPPSRRGDLPPLPPPPPDDDDDNDGGGAGAENKIQKFLLQKGNERVAEALAETTTSGLAAQPHPIAVSKAMTKLFPKIKEQELDFGEADKDDFPDTEDLDFADKEDLDFLDKPDKYDFPKPTVKKAAAALEQVATAAAAAVAAAAVDVDLDFYVGGDQNSKKLIENAVSYIGGPLNNSNKMFLEYLTSGFGKRVLFKNKFKIHLQSGQFVHNNVVINESIYDFLAKQQDETKKELLIEIPIQNDFEVYVREILSNVKDDDYDLHTNSTAKFLFYNFNMLRLINRLNPLTVRHSQIVSNEEAISILQTNNWQYFVEQLLHIANGHVDVNDFNLDNDQEFEKYTIIEKTSDNLNYCKLFYEEVFNDIAYFFQKMIKETPDEFLQPMKEDLVNEIYFSHNLKDIESHVELFKIFNRFYFKTGRFPGNSNLVVVPAGVKPNFVQSFDQISPVELNEKFQNTASYGLAAVHFLAGLNIYFGGEKNLSQDVMSELLYNLSHRVLSIDDKKNNLKFDQVINLNKNIKRLIRDVKLPDIKTVQFEKAIDNTKDKVQAIEDQVVNNIVTNQKLKFPVDFKPPMPNSVTEIQNDSEKGKAIKRKTNESLNEVYGEITRSEVAKARNDLVKSISDYDGDTPIEVINNVSASYDKKTTFTSTSTVANSVSKHVRESIKDRNQQYFKQRKPTVNRKIEKTVKPKLKITDIVNRDLFRSNSVTSIPISDVEMLSRSASLDSIVRFNRRDDDDDVVIEDQEMISRPSSAASIREQQQQQQPIKFVKPKRTVVVKPKQSTAAVAPATMAATVAREISKTVKNRPLKEQRKKDLAVLDQFLKNVKSIIPKTTVIKSPPTISLSQSIANKKPPEKEKPKLVKAPLPALTPVQLKRQKEAAKADKKTKQQEAVVRFRAKSEDIEMPPPVVFGKRKKDDRLDSETKTKKEN